jgi:hypothetical protein
MCPSEDLRLNDIENLRAVLERGLTPEAIDQWLDEGPSRRELLGGAVLTSIRWHQSLGYPGTPSLSGGFVHEHAACDLNWTRDGKPMPWKVVRRGPFLTIGALDGDHYAIGMAVYPADASANRLRVTLADVDWVKPPATPQTRVLFYRAMRRDEFEFPYSATYAAQRGGIVIPPFEVVIRPLF